MARGYRAILELPEKEDAHKIAYRLFSEWFENKYLIPAGRLEAGFEEDGIYRFGKLKVKRRTSQTEEVTVIRLRESSKDRHYHRQLLELVHSSGGNGRWRTRMYAMAATKESRYKQVIWIEVEPPLSANWDAKRPNLVCDLVEQYDVHESGILIRKSVTNVINEDEVDELVERIYDSRRRIAIVVASPISDDFDKKAHNQWQSVLNTLTDDSLGCASYFLLEPSVYNYFCNKVGELGLAKGCLRTYLPGADPGDQLDLKRHKILTSSTLYHGLDKNGKFRPQLSRIIAQTPCTYLWEKGLDGELGSAEKVLKGQKLKAPTFRLAPEMEGHSEVIEEEKLLPLEPVNNIKHPTVDEAKTRTKKADTCKEKVSSVAADHKERAVVKGNSIWRFKWFNNLVSLIRHFSAEFTPKSHSDMVDGVEILSTGFSSIYANYDTLVQKTNNLKQDFAIEKKNLQQQIDAYETLLDQVDENDHVYDELAQVKKAFEEQENERSDERRRIRELEYKVRKLEWKVNHPDPGEQEFYYEENWLYTPPNDMADLFDRMTAGGAWSDVCKYVEFYDSDSMLDEIMILDAKPETSQYAERFWEFILALRSYMKALENGDFQGDVHSYLGESGVCSQRRHAPTESETVKNNPRLREERTFAVPVEVDHRGKTEMYAHFKINGINYLRMHYYADTRRTNKVYIGYIGRHLTNTKTN